MRIISGQWGGRRIQPPKGLPARPTTDRAKEGLINILRNLINLEGISSLELFAGTGSVSYELASNGVTELSLVEQNRKSIQFIRQSLKVLSGPKWSIFQEEVARFLSKHKGSFELIFADPPYRSELMQELPNKVLNGTLLNSGGIFVLEHDHLTDFDQHPALIKTKSYGTTVFSFFKK